MVSRGWLEDPTQGSQSRASGSTGGSRRDTEALCWVRRAVSVSWGHLWGQRAILGSGAAVTSKRAGATSLQITGDRSI